MNSITQSGCVRVGRTSNGGQSRVGRRVGGLLIKRGRMPEWHVDSVDCEISGGRPWCRRSTGLISGGATWLGCQRLQETNYVAQLHSPDILGAMLRRGDEPWVVGGGVGCCSTSTFIRRIRPAMLHHWGRLRRRNIGLRHWLRNRPPQPACPLYFFFYIHYTCSTTSRRYWRHWRPPGGHWLWHFLHQSLRR